VTDAAKRVNDDIDRKVVDHVAQRGQVEDMFGHAVQRPWGPGDVTVPAQIERVDVISPCANPAPPNAQCAA